MSSAAGCVLGSFGLGHNTNFVLTQHWILDGFPRTLGQGELLNAHLKYVLYHMESGTPEFLTLSVSQGSRHTT
jgi:hypothetical protein